jgi:hypothetical protein
MMNLLGLNLSKLWLLATVSLEAMSWHRQTSAFYDEQERRRRTLTVHVPAGATFTAQVPA